MRDAMPSPSLGAVTPRPVVIIVVIAPSLSSMSPIAIIVIIVSHCAAAHHAVAVAIVVAIVFIVVVIARHTVALLTSLTVAPLPLTMLSSLPVAIVVDFVSRRAVTHLAIAHHHSHRRCHHRQLRCPLRHCHRRPHRIPSRHCPSHCRHRHCRWRPLRFRHHLRPCRLLCRRYHRHLRSSPSSPIAIIIVIVSRCAVACCAVTLSPSLSLLVIAIVAHCHRCCRHIPSCHCPSRCQVLM